MSGLKYVGVPVSLDPDLVYQDYATGIKGADLSTAAIDSAINSGLGSFTTKSYVDTRDALLATNAYVDAGDAARVRLSSKDVANGVAGLDATTKLDPNRFDVPSSQQFNRGPWTPAAYNTSNQSFSAETTLYTCPVTDPGYSYRLVVFGEVDARNSLTSEYPIVVVRVGSTSGQIISRGRGRAGTYNWSTGLNGGDNFERSAPSDLGGSAFWNSQFLAGSNVNGYDAISGGHEAQWVDTGGNTAYAMHQRTATADATTQTDNQLVTLTAGTVVAETTPTFDSDDAATFLINRMSNDFANMVLVGLFSVTGQHQAQWLYRRNGTFTSLNIHANITQSAGDVWSLGCVGRLFTLSKNGATVSTWNDTGNVSLLGSTARGWGWGHQAASRSFGSAQTTPGSVADARIQDNDFIQSSGPVMLVPQDLQSTSVLTGSTTLYVRGLRSGASSTVSTQPYRPRIHVMAVPA